MIAKVGSGLALASIIVVSACGGALATTPPTAKLQSACDAICEKRKGCDPRFDGAACKTRCTTMESVRRIEAFRPEATDLVIACLTTNACDAELSAKGQSCAVEVAKKLTAGPKAKALCAKLEPQLADCGTTWRMACVDELKFFAEEDLGVFDECVGRSCRSGTSCFRSAEDSLASRHR